MIAPTLQSPGASGDEPTDPRERLLLLAPEGEPWGLAAASAARAAGYSVERLSSTGELLRRLDPAEAGPSDDDSPGAPAAVVATGPSLAAASETQRSRLVRQADEIGFPVIVLTGEGERDGLRSLLDAGSVTVVETPASERVLATVLQGLRGQRERRRRVQELQDRLEELRNAGRREERLLARVGHELRNPLGAITTTLSLLRDLHDDPPSQGHLDLIERQVGLLRRAVDDLLDMAGIGSADGASFPPRNGNGGENRHPKPDAGSRTADPDAAGRPILVVEDDPDGGAALRDLLELWGYRVEMARRGETGVEEALRTRPAVALVDIDLPGIDGYEVARSIRRRYPEPRPLLVAMTGFGQPEDRVRALEAGFDLHLVKPVQPDRLEKLLREHLHGASPD